MSTKEPYSVYISSKHLNFKYQMKIMIKWANVMFNAQYYVIVFSQPIYSYLISWNIFELRDWEREELGLVCALFDAEGESENCFLSVKSVSVSISSSLDWRRIIKGRCVIDLPPSGRFRIGIWGQASAKSKDSGSLWELILMSIYCDSIG